MTKTTNKDIWIKCYWGAFNLSELCFFEMLNDDRLISVNLSFRNSDTREVFFENEEHRLEFVNYLNDKLESI